MNDRSDKPLVSIGIPIHNGEKTLKRALDGIVSQDYGNIEVIVSDNCSTDKTPEILEQYKTMLDIKVITQKNLLQIKDNFDFVLNMANGEYFMWHAHDDYISQRFVSENIRVLQCNSKIAVSQSMTRLFDAESEDELGDINLLKANTKEISGLELVNKIFSPVKINYFIYGLFRRDLIVKAFKYVPDTPSADRYFLLQFALGGYVLGYVNSPLYYRSVTSKPLIERYPKDKLALQIEKEKSQINILNHISSTQRMFVKSPLVNGKYMKRLLVLIIQFLFLLNSSFRKKYRSAFIIYFPRFIVNMVLRIKE